MSQLDAKQLGAVERWTALLAAGLIAVSYFVMSRPMLLGVSLGALLMVVNSWALRRIGMRVVKMANRPGLSILLFNLKMAVLIAVVYLVVRYLPIDAIGFLIGVSVFPVAVVIAAIHVSLTMPRDITPPGASE